MSWLFSRALVGACWPDISLAGEPFVRSKPTHIRPAFSFNARTTGFFTHSRSGMTFGPLTDRRGEELLMSYLAGFRAKRSVLRLVAGTTPRIFGPKCGELCLKFSPGSSLPRMSHGELSMPPATTSKRWVTKPEQFPLARKTWVVTTFGADIGYLHTPTTKANYSAASMQKWPSARFFTTVFGRPSPTNQEWLMGWPIGWSGLEPLETDRFLSWSWAHFLPSALRDAA